MFAIGVIELLALLAGFSPSASIESVLPDVDLPDAPDMPDASIEIGPLSAILTWFSVGRLPILVLFVIFLTAFGLSGYLLQALMVAILGGPISGFLAAIPPVIAGAFATRHLGRWLGRIFPRDQSEAASQKELIGSYATIIRGEAKRGQPAEAKTQDLRGRSHYVLIEPNAADTTYVAGDRVFIVGQDKNIYRATTRLNEQRS